MLSDFLVAHPSGPFFSLNDDEWSRAVSKYMSFLNNHGINFVEQTSTGSIITGSDGYFYNESILCQFDRLEFKEEFQTVPSKHIVILVDNVRTHSTKVIKINDFRYFLFSDSIFLLLLYT